MEHPEDCKKHTEVTIEQACTPLCDEIIEKVTGGGILEIKGYHEDAPKDDPWSQH